MTNPIKMFSALMIAGVGVFLIFQNCSQVEFAGVSASQNLQSSSDPTASGDLADDSVPPQDVSDNSPTPPTPTPSPIVPPVEPPQCANTGSHWNGQSCVTCALDEAWIAAENRCSSTNTDACRTYVEITQTSFEVPARTNDRVCYYIKLVDKVSLRSSKNFPNRRMDILARNHDSQNPPNTPPYIVDERTVGFKLLGSREVILSASTSGTREIYVDNFFLVEAKAGDSAAKLWASGTGDALMADSKRIIVDGQDLTANSFKVFASGGTARFQPVDLSPILPVNQSIQFRGSALDCGSVGETSDVYLLFR